jgi:hypothetical protein
VLTDGGTMFTSNNYVYYNDKKITEITGNYTNILLKTGNDNMTVKRKPYWTHYNLYTSIVII